MNKPFKFSLLTIFMISFLAISFPSLQAEAKQNESNKVIAISSGTTHSLALKKDGSVWAWGGNNEGQLGNGTRTGKELPTQVKLLNNVQAVSAGQVHSLALKKDGSVWAWGSNMYGQLGIGTNVGAQSTPEKVQGLSRVKAISAGYHSLALKEDGTVWLWGQDIGTPIEVKGLRDVIAISAAGYHSMALKADGTVWTWAWSDNGKLKDGTVNFKVVKVEGITDVNAIHADDYSMALKKDGTVWIWGDNESVGLPGEGGIHLRRDSPRQIPGLNNITALSSGIALKKDGTLWTWRGWAGEHLANPVQTSGLADVVDVDTSADFSIALKKDGTVWAWGEKYNHKVVELYFDNQTTTVIGRMPSITDFSYGNSLEEIQKKWLMYKPVSVKSTFLEEPVTKSPYKLGKLDPTYITNGVKMTNFARYLAELPDDLVADEQLNIQAQHGAVLLSAHGELTHTPGKPKDMSQDFYNMGYKSTTSSNIYQGHHSLDSAVLAFMRDDIGSTNISGVGHRRWILNPSLKKIGFGHANVYTSMQVFDQSRKQSVDYNYISWPNKGSFPKQFFFGNVPWSVTLNPTKYENPFYSEVKVNLTRKSDLKVWTFDHTDNDVSSNKDFFNLSFFNAGEGTAIIFQPGDIDSFEDGDEFMVKITGITDKNGNQSPINYTVHFFDLFKKDLPSEWAKTEVNHAIELNLVPKNIQFGYTKNITREDFSKLVVNLVTVKTGKTIKELLEESGKKIDYSNFKDTDDSAILVANALGIVNGKGNGIFDPNGHLTRQQAALMLTRTAEVLEMDVNRKGKSFTDWKSIPEWAKDAVAFVSSAEDPTNHTNVMGGSEGKFNPNGNYTKQHAYITIKRLYNAH